MSDLVIWTGLHFLRNMKENKLVPEIAVVHDEKRSPSYNKFRGEKYER